VYLLKRIFDEAAPDFSAETCERATLSDLDPDAVNLFRQAWSRKAGNPQLDKLSVEQLLSEGERRTARWYPDGKDDAK